MSLLEPSRTYKPFNYPWAMEFAIDHERMHWGEWEAELQEDVNQWKDSAKGLSSVEKDHILQILRLFTQTDLVVQNNYSDVFIPLFKNNEIRNLLLSIANRESTHERAYALLNDTLGLDESEYWAFLEYEEMAKKEALMHADRFVVDFSKPDEAYRNLGYTLVQTVVNEGVALFSAFAMLLNYQRYGKMKGMGEIVEWSIKDESLHVEAMVRLFREYCKERPEILTDSFKRTVYDAFRKAVDLEDKVIDLAYQTGGVEGLTPEEMKTYIRYIADRRLIQLGFKPNFGVDTNPIPWLEDLINAPSHKNFFEGRETEYSKDGMNGGLF